MTRIIEDTHERELEDVLTVQQSTFHLPAATICRHLPQSLEVERSHEFGSFERVVSISCDKHLRTMNGVLGSPKEIP